MKILKTMKYHILLPVFMENSRFRTVTLSAYSTSGKNEISHISSIWKK